jgi:hypothetical protein
VELSDHVAIATAGQGIGKSAALALAGRLSISLVAPLIATWAWFLLSLERRGRG